MKGYIAFIKKEFVENLKNYRFFILFTIFAIFGLSSAFLAKFTPEIIEALGAGFEATEEPVALDAWQQFYKNISGVGFSALIIKLLPCVKGVFQRHFASAGNKGSGKTGSDFDKVHRSGCVYDGQFLGELCRCLWIYRSSLARYFSFLYRTVCVFHVDDWISIP